MTDEKEERNREIVERIETTDDSFEAIGKDYGISGSRVGQIGEKYGAVRERGEREEGDRAIRGGIPVVFLPDHPRARSSGWVPEKVVVAEENMGRPLKRDEVVALRDGDPTNVSAENVEVRTRREHARIIGSKKWRYEDDEDLLTALRWLAIEMDHTPRSVDVNVYLPFSHQTYYSAFGSMLVAQELAGLEPNTRGKGKKAEPLSDDFLEAYGHLEKYDSVEEAIAGEKEAVA